MPLFLKVGLQWVKLVLDVYHSATHVVCFRSHYIEKVNHVLESIYIYLYNPCHSNQHCMESDLTGHLYALVDQFRQK